MDISAIGQAKALAALYDAAVSKLFAGQNSRVPVLIDEIEAQKILDLHKATPVCSVVLANIAYTVDCEEQENIDGVLQWVPKQVIQHLHSSVFIGVDFTIDDIDLTNYNRMYGEGYGESILKGVENV